MSTYFTLSPTSSTPSTSTTTYLWSNYYNYNYGYGYDYDSAYNYYLTYGVWPSWYNNGYGYNYNRTATFAVTPIINSSANNIANSYDIYYSWTINSSSSSSALSTSSLSSSSYPYGGSSCTVDGYYLSGNTSYTLRCTATAYPKGVTQSSANAITASLSWTIRTDYYNYNYGTLSATASLTQGDTLYLNSTNSYTSTSVIDQLNSQIRNHWYNGSSYYGRYLSSITFSNTTSNGTSLSSSTGSYSSSSSSNFGNLYITPTTSALSSNSTATFSFTASDDYGNRYSGTLTVTVRPGVTSGGSFSVSGTQGENLNLSAGDFSSWWRGLYSSGNLSYVRFTSASGGSVYANLNTSRSNVVSSTGGTSCYVSPSGTQTGINSLTFVPSSSTTTSATLNFTAFGTSSSSSASTVSRTGTVNVTLKAPTVAQNVTVRYSCVSTGSVAFSYTDFYYSNSAVQTSSYITFGSPSSGTLSAGGSAVTSSSRFSFAGSTSGYQNIGTITYTPAASYSGSVTIPFYAYNASGSVVANGTVQITVTAPATPSTPTTTVSFSDVPSSNEYYRTQVIPTLNRLVGAGIVGGYPDGTYKPNGEVSNGEALKLIMRAAGFAEQPNATGSSAAGYWASNYRTAAINAGIITADQMSVADLGKPMNRATIAEITAKALKLTPVTNASSSPFADSTNQWVLAVYNTKTPSGTPIMQGTQESSGNTYFYGTQSLSRAQIALIVERVMDYKNGTTTPSTTTPSTPSTTTPSNNQRPSWLDS